jgi:hypothetical protein
LGDITGFLPSTHGLHYSNSSWPHEPDLTLSTPFGNIPIGDASNGLCGGMVFAVRDLFDAGRQPPPDRANPPGNGAAFNYLVGRLFDSFNVPGGVIEYYTWMNLPTHNTLLGPKGLSDLTINESMPIVRHTIDAGQPCPLGLVCVHSSDPTMLGKNHQVLAFGYEDAGAMTTVRVYDPNLPDDDGVTISFNHTNPAHTTTFNYSGGETPLGFFTCTWYRAHDPAPLLGPSSPPPPPPPPLPTLRTSCQPAAIQLGKATTFVVTAVDARTSKPVAGNVMVDGVRVGATGARITHTFFLRRFPSPPMQPARPVNGGGGDLPVLPSVTVAAEGYQFAKVAIEFT